MWLNKIVGFGIIVLAWVGVWAVIYIAGPIIANSAPEELYSVFKGWAMSALVDTVAVVVAIFPVSVYGWWVANHRVPYGTKFDRKTGRVIE